MTMPVRIQRKRTRGWKMPPNTVSVTRPGKWGNPFDFRRSEFCWAALSFGCRADPAGRQEASVRAFRDWIDPPHGRQTLSFEEQPKLGNGKRDMALGPLVKAGAAPSREEIRTALRGKNLACFCALDQPCHADVLLEMANQESHP
ncbi:MAG: hypothetical protein JWP25_8990 [Bradyrhizobium sp.]|nr:hypothetical protein [Bradyrhizobium sp.]